MKNWKIFWRPNIRQPNNFKSSRATWPCGVMHLYNPWRMAVRILARTWEVWFYFFITYRCSKTTLSWRHFASSCILGKGGVKYHWFTFFNLSTALKNWWIHLKNNEKKLLLISVLITIGETETMKYSPVRERLTVSFGFSPIFGVTARAYHGYKPLNLID